MALIDAQPEADAATRARVLCPLGGDLDLRADGVVRRRGGLVVARPTDAPVRTDLPRSHPLYGLRVVRVVPAGTGDAVIGDDGRLAPAATGAAAAPVEIERVR